MAFLIVKMLLTVFAGNEVHITLTIRLNPSYIKMDANVNKESTLENKELSVVKAHQIATDIQDLILKNTGASRVIIHTEPD